MIAIAGTPTTFGQSDDEVWPTVEPCEAVVASPVSAASEVDDARSATLVERLRDPASPYELAFRSRLTRHGAVFGDGEELDIDVPVITADFVGTARIDGSDHLAYLALANGPWSLAERRDEGELRTRMPTSAVSWLDGAVEAADALRLPDALRAAETATPMAARSGHWYALRTATDLGPGILWDNTRDIFPVIRDAETILAVEAADDGTPVQACLMQRWWQGQDDVFGEDASMLSAIRFVRLGSAPPLPATTATGGRERAAEIDMEFPLPRGGATRWDGRFQWIWLDDTDELPRLRVSRARFPDELLADIRELGQEPLLEALAQNDAASARLGWGRDPLTVEYARIGGADGQAGVPARMLLFHPELEEHGSVLAIDIVAFVEPWSYLFQYVAPLEDELGGRYLLEQVLEGARFLCSEGEGGACPPR